MFDFLLFGEHENNFNFSTWYNKVNKTPAPPALGLMAERGLKSWADFFGIESTILQHSCCTRGKEVIIELVIINSIKLQ